MAESEVARFRQVQALQERAAQQGINGFAAVAAHERITARAQRGADRILQLIQEGEHEEARRLMELKTWGVDE